MADTGRTVFADGLWADDLWAVGLWATDAAVIVPDVVGETEAQATIDITAVGLTVSATTAYSSTVAAGLVISQVPAGGSSVAPGSDVAIVVSLGDAPVTDTTTGGWWPDYDHARRQRDKRRRELEAQEREQEAIEDTQAREIAALMRAQEVKDAERADLDRLQKLADTYSGQKIGLPKPVSSALINAYEARSRNALLQLRREIERAQEDEEMAVTLAVMMLLS